MYGKHFASMYEGSMLGIGANVFAVWGWIISHAVSGSVEANPKLLAFQIGMTVPEVEAALEYLQKPDPNSRNPECHGRRIVRDGQFQFKVVSHEVYKKMQSPEDRRDYMRGYMRKRRSGTDKSNKTNTPVNLDVNGKPPVSALGHTEAYADTEANTDKRTIAQSVPPEELAGTLPLVDGSEFPIFKSQVSEWQIAYPGIDVRTQLVQAKVWLQANPKRRKTRKGILRYLNSWLSRAQDKPQWSNGANGHAKTGGTGKQAELIAMLHELDEDPTEGAIANGDASRGESFQRAN